MPNLLPAVVFVMTEQNRGLPVIERVVAVGPDRFVF